MTAKPSPKAEIRDAFRGQLDKLVEAAEAAHKAAKMEGRRKWFKPKLNGWNGDLFDIEGIADAFKRDEIHEDYLKAIKSAEDPGVSGDLAAAQFQGDWLASMERAFRRRHTTPVRSRLQAAARLYGHGHDKGPLKQGVMKWIEGIIQNNKQQ